MEVRIETNAKEVAKRVKKKGKALSDSVKKALSITAESGVRIILDRTGKSTGFKGGKFDAYSPLYAAFRADRGRGQTPDLYFTGQMLGSIITRSSSTQAEIFFSRAAASKKAAMNNKNRPFFGFSRKEEQKLGQIFFKALK